MTDPGKDQPSNNAQPGFPGFVPMPGMGQGQYMMPMQFPFGFPMGMPGQMWPGMDPSSMAAGGMPAGMGGMPAGMHGMAAGVMPAGMPNMAAGGVPGIAGMPGFVPGQFPAQFPGQFPMFFNPAMFGAMTPEQFLQMTSANAQQDGVVGPEQPAPARDAFGDLGGLGAASSASRSSTSSLAVPVHPSSLATPMLPSSFANPIPPSPQNAQSIPDDTFEDFGDFATANFAQQAPAAAAPSIPTLNGSLASQPTQLSSQLSDDGFGDFNASQKPLSLAQPRSSFSSSVPTPTARSSISKPPPPPAVVDDDDFGDFNTVQTKPKPSAPAVEDDDFGDFNSIATPRIAPAAAAKPPGDFDDFGEFSAVSKQPSSKPKPPPPPTAPPVAVVDVDDDFGDFTPSAAIVPRASIDRLPTPALISEQKVNVTQSNSDDEDFGDFVPPPKPVGGGASFVPATAPAVSASSIVDTNDEFEDFDSAKPQTRKSVSGTATAPPVAAQEDDEDFADFTQAPRAPSQSIPPAPVAVQVSEQRRRSLDFLDDLVGASVADAPLVLGELPSLPTTAAEEDEFGTFETAENGFGSSLSSELFKAPAPSSIQSSSGLAVSASSGDADDFGDFVAPPEAGNDTRRFSQVRGSTSEPAKPEAKAPEAVEDDFGDFATALPTPSTSALRSEAKVIPAASKNDFESFGDSVDDDGFTDFKTSVPAASKPASLTPLAEKPTADDDDDDDFGNFDSAQGAAPPLPSTLPPAAAETLPGDEDEFGNFVTPSVELTVKPVAQEAPRGLDFLDDLVETQDNPTLTLGELSAPIVAPQPTSDTRNAPSGSSSSDKSSSAQNSYDNDFGDFASPSSPASDDFGEFTAPSAFSPSQQHNNNESNVSKPIPSSSFATSSAPTILLTSPTSTLDDEFGDFSSLSPAPSTLSPMSSAPARTPIASAATATAAAPTAPTAAATTAPSFIAPPTTSSPEFDDFGDFNTSISSPLADDDFGSFVSPNEALSPLPTDPTPTRPTSITTTTTPSSAVVPASKVDNDDGDEDFGDFNAVNESTKAQGDDVGAKRNSESVVTPMAQQSKPAVMNVDMFEGFLGEDSADIAVELPPMQYISAPSAASSSASCLPLPSSASSYAGTFDFGDFDGSLGDNFEISFSNGANDGDLKADPRDPSDEFGFEFQSRMSKSHTSQEGGSTNNNRHQRGYSISKNNNIDSQNNNNNNNNTNNNMNEDDEFGDFRTPSNASSSSFSSSSSSSSSLPSGSARSNVLFSSDALSSFSSPVFASPLSPSSTQPQAVFELLISQERFGEAVQFKECLRVPELQRELADLLQRVDDDDAFERATAVRKELKALKERMTTIKVDAKERGKLGILGGTMLSYSELLQWVESATDGAKLKHTFVKRFGVPLQEIAVDDINKAFAVQHEANLEARRLGGLLHQEYLVYAQVWLKMLVAVTERFEHAASVTKQLATLGNPQHAALSDFFMALTEMAGVCSRIENSYHDFHVEDEGNSQLTAALHNFTAAKRNISHVLTSSPNQDSQEHVCCLCLTSVSKALILHESRWMHASCGNLYLHMIGSPLP